MKNVILIGFMGSGKTTCGKELSGMLGCDFCDTDEMIEQEQQMSVSEIFEKYKEPYFRELETKLIKKLQNKKIGVMSVGGGLVVTEGNAELLKKIGTVVYLRASKECLIKRLENDNTRPLLLGGNLEEKITSLMKKRESIYISAADTIIDTDGLSVLAVCEKIVEVI